MKPQEQILGMILYRGKRVLATPDVLKSEKIIFVKRRPLRSPGTAFVDSGIGV